MRPVRVLLRRLAPAPAPAPGPAVPADPNEPYTFKPGPDTGDAGGTVTLDRLFHLSRAL